MYSEHSEQQYSIESRSPRYFTVSCKKAIVHLMIKVGILKYTGKGKKSSLLGVCCALKGVVINIDKSVADYGILVATYKEKKYDEFEVNERITSKQNRIFL
jgi:hypothetical protein